MTDPNAPVPVPSTLGDKPLLTTIQQLKALQAEYRMVREKYSPEHPDVKKLKSQIANLEQALKHTPDNQGNEDRLSAPDNPVYISLKAQLESTKADLNSARQEKVLLKEKLANYEARLYKTPAIERDYLNLSRDYELAKKNYEDIQQKLVRAGLAQQLEEEAKGERFTLIEPAHGASPTPKRRIIAFLGLILAFGSGIGSISIAELLDKSVRGLRGIQAILNAPPLAAIPFIKTPEEIARQRNRRRISSLLITLTTILALMLIHHYWMPISPPWSGVSESNDRTASDQEKQ
jgi:uncharacterized protein involved in exopolysaccharide biosynthesis